MKKECSRKVLWLNNMIGNDKRPRLGGGERKATLTTLYNRDEQKSISTDNMSKGG